jgi:hypothetical protein
VRVVPRDSCRPDHARITLGVDHACTASDGAASPSTIPHLSETDMSFHHQRPGPAGASRRRLPLGATAHFALLALCVAASCAGGGDALAAPASSTPTPSGPVEITQAKAITGNVTPGDAAGFPVTISVPGSYKLVGNLTVSDIHTTAVVITANDVTLDLNGFAILGPNNCGFPPYAPTCQAGLGTGDGISIAGPSNRLVNVSIRNGVVRGMGRDGVSDGNGNRYHVLLDSVRLLDNAGHGVSLSGALITHSAAIRNGGDGLSLHGGGQVESSLAWFNGGWGLIGSPATSYGGGSFYGNGAGQAYGALVQTAGNACNGVKCP